MFRIFALQSASRPKQECGSYGSQTWSSKRLAERLVAIEIAVGSAASESVERSVGKRTACAFVEKGRHSMWGPMVRTLHGILRRIASAVEPSVLLEPIFFPLNPSTTISAEHSC